MGCDIHAYLEIKRFHYDDKNRENGIWINADKWTKNEFAVLHPEEKEKLWAIDYDDRIWGSRWYFLFAILAGVRNAWDITPISKPKGFPEDASIEVKEANEYWGVDGHSHSWLTLRELEEWEGWEIKTTNDDGMAVPYKDVLKNEFHTKTIERMQKKVNRVVTQDDVRMVFWFDN